MKALGSRLSTSLRWAALAAAIGGGFGCAKGSGDLDDASPDDAASAVSDAGAADAASAGPDAGATAAGNPATGGVAGGVKAQSANYKLVGTMNKGESTAASPSYKYKGGVLGATQP